uniref:Uncharacterized protein n=1 Tax=Ascaris lumbricoides TaxID=6252 RepID=A0A9J2PMF7_ASCLU
MPVTAENGTEFSPNPDIRQITSADTTQPFAKAYERRFHRIWLL